MLKSGATYLHQPEFFGGEWQKLNSWKLGQGLGLPRWCSGKDSTCYWRRCKRSVFDPWAGKIPWRKKWQPTPVFLPGELSPAESMGSQSQTWWARTASRGQKLALGTMSAPSPPPLQVLGIASQPSLLSWVHELSSFLHDRDRAASPWVSNHRVPATRNTSPLSCLSDPNFLNPPPLKGSNLA